MQTLLGPFLLGPLASDALRKVVVGVVLATGTAAAAAAWVWVLETDGAGKEEMYRRLRKGEPHRNREEKVGEDGEERGE